MPLQGPRSESFGEADVGLAEKDLLDESFADGSDDVLRVVYERYGSLVWSIARRSLPEEDAREITQDTFVAAWRARGSFDPARGTLAPWLATIARNKITDRIRARERRGEAVSIPDEQVDPVAEQSLNTLVDRLLVADALESLAPRARTVIELSFFGGLSLPEISERCDLPLGTVKSDQRRGLARLRRHLERGHG